MHPVPLTLRAPSVDASDRAGRALGERGRRMSSVAVADARRRRAAELRAECERLRDEHDLFEVHLARIAPPGTEQAPEEDAEDAGAKRSKGSKKSKAKTDAPVVRDRLTDAERLDAVTAESELLERVQREAEAANERGLMDLARGVRRGRRVPPGAQEGCARLQEGGGGRRGERTHGAGRPDAMG